MKAEEIKVGGLYKCRLDQGGVQPVKVERELENKKGWWVQPLGQENNLQHVDTSAQFRDVYDPEQEAAKANAKAAAKQPKAEQYTEKDEVIDPSICYTKRCKSEPVMTYLGKPLCQACWQAVAKEEATGDPGEETDVTKTKKNKSGKNKSTKALKTAKPVVEKTPKAEKPIKVRDPNANGSLLREDRPGALEAALKVLQKAGKPMAISDIATAIASKDLWKPRTDKPMETTLKNAIESEIGKKGKAARFKKVEANVYEAR